LQAFLGEKMYAIVNIAGKQYKVAEGDKLQVARLSSKVGDKVNFDNVLLTDDGKNIKIGKPAVKGAVVSAEILEHGRLKKILVYKKKRRKGYQRKNGHRQDFSSIKVNSITISTPTKKAPAKKTAAAKTTKKESK
jgi:large subunit ribosomal protein L21